MLPASDGHGDGDFASDGDGDGRTPFYFEELDEILEATWKKSYL